MGIRATGGRTRGALRMLRQRIEQRRCWTGRQIVEGGEVALYAGGREETVRPLIQKIEEMLVQMRGVTVVHSQDGNRQ